MSLMEIDSIAKLYRKVSDHRGLEQAAPRGGRRVETSRDPGWGPSRALRVSSAVSQG